MHEIIKTVYNINVYKAFLILINYKHEMTVNFLKA